MKITIEINIPEEAITKELKQLAMTRENFESFMVKAFSEELDDPMVPGATHTITIT